MFLISTKRKSCWIYSLPVFRRTCILGNEHSGYKLSNSPNVLFHHVLRRIEKVPQFLFQGKSGYFQQLVYKGSVSPAFQHETRLYSYPFQVHPPASFCPSFPWKSYLINEGIWEAEQLIDHYTLTSLEKRNSREYWHMSSCIFCLPEMQQIIAMQFLEY